MDWLAEKQKIHFASTPDELRSGNYVLPADELRGDYLLLEVDAKIDGQPLRTRMNVAAEMYREALLSVGLRQHIGLMFLRQMSELIGSNA